ncbi:serine hydrolase domain-containing protein [uncultured Enterovirga sp.]|uniref:serine hydrolase domain-containing protein n=1 Tax=uncultured Enterovirga sp. TaxID=2026352 RepID=UPI0035CBF1C5
MADRPAWLDGALAYAESWLAIQLRVHEQPGVAVAVAHEGEIVFERAFGCADLATGEPLTPRHRMRVASQSKSFTAAGILCLLDEGKLRLDDRCGTHVSGLHPSVAVATIGQLLSHSGGIVRDGPDSSQFVDRIPYRGRAELLADLAEPSPVETGLRLKYSNHGYGLLGLVIEAVTGQPYPDWIAERVIRPAGLTETVPDAAFAGSARLASGHSGKRPLGRRVVIPGHNPTHAIAPAGGFVSTAADLARFFGQLDPAAPTSILSAASRREMTRRHWRDDGASLERHYGLGLEVSAPGSWATFGHSGGLQGFISRTLVVPEPRLAISVLTNAIDGPAHGWVDGLVHILRRFKEADPTAEGLAAWRGRWWSIWGAVDLVPVGQRVLAAYPALFLPFADAAEIEVTGPDEGRIVKSQGFGSPGEAVRVIRGEDGAPRELQLGGAFLSLESDLVREMEERYAPPPLGVVGAITM